MNRHCLFGANMTTYFTVWVTRGEMTDVMTNAWRENKIHQYLTFPGFKLSLLLPGVGQHVIYQKNGRINGWIDGLFSRNMSEKCFSDSEGIEYPVRALQSLFMPQPDFLFCWPRTESRSSCKRKADGAFGARNRNQLVAQTAPSSPLAFMNCFCSY